jgi:phosphoglycerate dehydrogenase-like enzyme
MIKILIADDLSTGTIDKLNEIPEFEITEKANFTSKKFASEIKNVEALVVSGATLLTSAILESAVNLKIIVLIGAGPTNVDTTMASLKNIEIRNTRFTENQEQVGLNVIAILKEFFNV